MPRNDWRAVLGLFFRIPLACASGGSAPPLKSGGRVRRVVCRCVCWFLVSSGEVKAGQVGRMGDDVPAEGGLRRIWPVAAAAAAFALKAAACRADFGIKVTERRRAFPAMRVFHPGHDFPEKGIKRQNFPTRIRRHAQCVHAEDQPLDGHHFVELAAWSGEVVESRCLVIVVAQCGVRMDLEESFVVLDAHHGANG
jgi:hypothetical protein